MKRVAEQIADWLVAHDITQAFTVTGGGAMFLNQALGGHSALHTVFMHHEQACAMAAEGYARVTNKPAVVMVTTGPGAINALNGVYGAFTDSIPMIVISGQVKRETCLDFHDLPHLRQLGDQEGPIVAMAKPVCKFARTIRDAQELEWALPEALATATSGRPGPVWLDIPLDIQSAQVELNFHPVAIETPQPSQALAAQCAEIVSRLKAAHRPLILGGTGVRLAGVVDRVVALAEATGIPMATAWTHDLIASDHPLCAGRPGTIGTRAGNFCTQNADVIIVLGSRLNIRQTSYNFESFARNAWVAHIDVDHAELNKPTYQADFGVEADLRCFLDALEAQLNAAQLPDYSAWATWCREIGHRYSVASEHVQLHDGPLNPYLMVDRVFHHLRDDDIIVCANASACILPFQIGALKRNQRMFSNSGSASMGYDLPAALGAARADPKRRVICFAGDGSLMMNMQELQTLKTSGLNVVVIILNNAGYLSIWQTHENFFGRVIGATPMTGVEFPDFCALGQAFGLTTSRIVTVDDVAVLTDRLAENGPQIIELIVDPRQEFTPRIKSRTDADGKFITPELDDMHPFLPPEELKAVRDSAQLIRQR